MLVDHSTESSTFSGIEPPKPILSEKSNMVNTEKTLNQAEIKKIKKEIQRWFSILTQEYIQWQAREYMDSFLLTTEWVKTKEDNENNK